MSINFFVQFCNKLSNIIRVLDLAKTAPQEAVTDEVSLLLAIKVQSRKEGRKNNAKFIDRALGQ